jgi:hypothetical protein
MPFVLVSVSRSEARSGGQRLFPAGNPLLPQKQG